MHSILPPTEPGTALALIPEAMTAVQLFAPGVIDPILDEIERQARAFAGDISSEKGRKEIASFAHKLARSKTFLDARGKELSAEFKVKSNAIDEERRRIWDRLEELQAEVKKPLDDYRAAEKLRIDGHEAAIAEIRSAAEFAEARPSSDVILARLSALRTPSNRQWDEFLKRATDATTDMIVHLEARLADALKAEAEAVELARLRAEQQERDRLAEVERQRQREATIAAEAAEKAKREAEQKAADEAAEVARAAKAEQDRIAREAAAATARAEQAEHDRVAAEKRAAQAERDRIAAAEKAEADRVEALAQAERDRLAAEQKAEQDREAAAIKAEADRIDAEARAVEQYRRNVAEQARKDAAAAAERERDKTHRAAINRAAAAALVAEGLSEPAAKSAITAIALGKVPAVAISY